MKEDDLDYRSLLGVLKKYTDKGRPVSIAFLNWFLENIYRLDQITAEDVICDKSNDRGIDGLYVNYEQNEIHVLQSKTKQNGTIGDKDIREFSGTLNQLRTENALETFLNGKVDSEIKDKINKIGMMDLVKKGFEVKGIFVTNADIDANGIDMLKNDPALVGYDRAKIIRDFVDLNVEGGVKGVYEFRIDGILEHQADATTKVVVFFAEGQQLASMPGIADGKLFELNVRLPLGSTNVNKAIRKSIELQRQHHKFALFHNGVTILAERVLIKDETVEVTNFVVVNGAQSLKQFHNTSSKITNDLRVLARVIEIGADKELALEISTNSNNQNGIKPRDLRSNDILQTRLQAEFDRVDYEHYQFDVKRGDDVGDNAISNEYAGKLLLAFDLNEPWSCHQTYKVFDEKYADIFGRPEVNAYRIIFLHKVMQLINECRTSIRSVPFAHYGLTIYMILTLVRRLLELDEVGKRLCRNPKIAFDNDRVECVLDVVRDLLKSAVIDINHELDNGQMADYKSELKSRTSVDRFLNELIRSYQKDMMRGKVDNIGDRLRACDVA